MMVIGRKANNIFTILLCLCFLALFKFVYTPVTTIQEIQTPLIQEPELDCRPKCRIAPLQSEEQFYKYFTQIDYNCQNLKFFGINDGRKAVCMDPELHVIPGDCNVLSFGINNEWSFDDGLDKAGCKVYAFDPTMGKEDHQRSENIQFFKLGLSNMQGTRRVGMDSHFDYFQVDTLENIINRLQLTNKTISYLKMDIELSELDFFQDVFRNTPYLLQNIKQIAIELHHGYHGDGLALKARQPDLSATSAFTLFWQYFEELRCYGFKLMHSHKNGPWTEVVWAQI